MCKRMANPKKPRIVLTCVDCSKERTVRATDYKRIRCLDCSNERKKQPREAVRCLFCDTSFLIVVGGVRQHKFCNVGCYNGYRHARKQTPKQRVAAVHNWIKRNPERVNASSRKRYHERNVRALKYGLTPEQFEGLRAKGCWLCGGSFEGVERRAIAIDHDHKTQVVRGLAHASCNFVIGHAKESVEALLNIAESLRRYQSAEVWVA